MKIQMMNSITSAVWLVRHGQRMDTDPNWHPKVCHHTEVPLSPLGEQMADALGRRLASSGIRHLFCSPFLRAVQTATAITRHIGLPIWIENGAGEWQNKDWFPNPAPLQSVEQLAEQFPTIDPSYRSRVDSLWPETQEQVSARMKRTIHLLTAEFDGQILIVGHGATVTGMAAALLDPPYPVEDAQCAVVRIGQNRQGAWRLQINGDTDHLASLGGARY